MELRSHYFITLAALFILGILVARPGTAFQATSDKHCRFLKGKLECEVRIQEYQLNHPVIHYVYE
jgi:hypothetical protein